MQHLTGRNLRVLMEESKYLKFLFGLLQALQLHSFLISGSDLLANVHQVLLQQGYQAVKVVNT